MADLRLNSEPLDDFNRNENPLSLGGKWAQMDATRPPLQCALIGSSGNGSARRTGTISAYSYWTPLTMDGDDAQCWSYTRGGNASAQAWGWVLGKDFGGSGIWDAYSARMEIGTGGGSCVMYRITNGGSTTLQSNPVNPPTGGGWLGLIRRNGSHVEFWASDDGQVGNSWTKYLDVVDTTYVNGLKAALHCFGGLVEHDYYGAGPVDFIPQFAWRRRHVRLPV